MTYKDQFVAEVKCKGKILRVKDDSVSLPFGSEYSILLKNLNSRRVSVNIHIDGEDVLDCHSLILGSNETTEIKGFLSGNVARNRFKFIQKTKEIQDHRGDRIDDGMIRIEFAFEQEVPQIIKKSIIHEEHRHNTYYYHNYPFDWNYGRWFTGNSGVRYTSDNSSSAEPIKTFYSNSAGQQPGDFKGVTEMSNLCLDSLDQPAQDEGITVKGSECDQQFRYSAMGELDPSQVIVIKLKGMNSSGTIVSNTVDVKTKLTCRSCGRTSKSSFKFCPNCGTYLE